MHFSQLHQCYLLTAQSEGFCITGGKGTGSYSRGTQRISSDSAGTPLPGIFPKKTYPSSTRIIPHNLRGYSDVV